MEQKSKSESEKEKLYQEAIQLLMRLISTPSFSGEEEETAALIIHFLEAKEVRVYRKGNNVWAKNYYFDKQKPTILLNSHHDTVKPNRRYSVDPFCPIQKEGKLFGLGSNDAGGALVSLLSVFLYFHKKREMAYNFIIAATAEEEISGDYGIVSILDELGEIDFAIVGEPTNMQMAIAEKALLVIDCTAKGTPSHAAHPNDDNAIYKALKDVKWVKDYEFTKTSKWLGEVKMTATVINAGELHNQVPAECNFTIDIRVTDAYTTQEVFEVLKENLSSTIRARSLKRNSSAIPENHPFVLSGKSLGRSCYGSPTSSDQALIPYPSLKMGPGDSFRSHTANEFIYLEEVKEGIELYIKILENIL